jgi:hypothetical protein
MSSKIVMPTMASRSPWPSVGSVWGLYITVFTSIAALAWVIQRAGVAFVMALPVASGVATLTVSLVNSLLGRGHRASVAASDPLADDVRPRW